MIADLQAPSLKRRVLVVALIFSTLAVLVAGAGFFVLLARHLDRDLGVRLERAFADVAGSLRRTPEGVVRLDHEAAVARTADTIYWQAMQGETIVLRSATLGTNALTVPAAVPTRQPAARVRMSGPGGVALERREQLIRLDGDSSNRLIRLVVAIDRTTFDALHQALMVEVALFVAGLSLLLWIAAAAQVRIGLKPLSDLRADLARARRGLDGQLMGSYPTEIMPLVGDLNNLIGAQAGAVQRARARAGDLAHGLKTPLAVLDVEVRRLRERGEPDVADAIATELRAMTRVVERELARARIASAGFTATVPLAPSIERIVRAVRRLPRGADLDWRIQCPPDLVVAMDPTDLDELLGNALDNARKWATSVVTVSAQGGAKVALTIDDDGPGIPPEVRDRAVQRGVRLDESTQGTGLGLAIMDDLMATYGGQMRLDTAPLGGLRVALQLPT